MFDSAAVALDAASIVHGGDGFPRLRGRYRGFEVQADLIPDTMVVRRLPQLWLSVTLLAPNPDVPAFAMLVRYAGNEFYSLAAEFACRLEPPSGFPAEVLIRAERPEAQAILDSLQAPLIKLLSDARIKEVAITSKGLRIIRQAAEGLRGEHLILRQAVFDTPGVSSADLNDLLNALAGLHALLSQRSSARAA